jgi:hypothetical protein
MTGGATGRHWLPVFAPGGACLRGSFQGARILSERRVECLVCLKVIAVDFFQQSLKNGGFWRLPLRHLSISAPCAVVKLEHGDQSEDR